MSNLRSVSRSRRILILSAGFGAGHNSVARTLSDAIRNHWPQVELQTTDILQLAPAVCRSVSRGLHYSTFTRAPWLYALAYRSGDRRQAPQPGLSERCRSLLLAPLQRPIARLVRTFQPDLVLHTHSFGISPVARIRAAQRDRLQHAVVITDVIAHRMWYSPGVDHWLVAAPESTERLRNWGIPDSSITVSGIPVDPVWRSPARRSDAFRHWSLPPERPVILLSGGTFFTVGPIAAIAQRLQAACPGAVTVVLCGTNSLLLRELERLPEIGETLFAIPYTDRVHELVSQAVVFVTKSGGVTTTECLAAGTPMVLMPPVPGQEARNAAWLKQHGAAIVGRDLSDVVRHVQRLLRNPAERQTLSQSARALFRPGRETVLAYVRNCLNLP